MMGYRNRSSYTHLSCIVRLLPDLVFNSLSPMICTQVYLSGARILSYLKAMSGNVIVEYLHRPFLRYVHEADRCNSSNKEVNTNMIVQQ